MILEFEQTAKDYMEFSYYYSWTGPNQKETRIITSLVPLLVFIFVIFFKKGLRFEYYGKSELLLILLGILFFFCVPYFIKWNSNRIIKNLIEGGKNEDMIGPRSIAFEEDKLIAITKYSRLELLWPGFEKLGETKNYFFLFLSVNQAIVLPKRIFNSEEEIEYLRSFINRKLVRNTTA